MERKIVEIEITADYREGDDKIKVKIDTDDKNGKSILIKNFYTIAELYKRLDEDIKEVVFKSISETKEEKKKKRESVEKTIENFSLYKEDEEINILLDDYIILIEFLRFLRDALMFSKEENGYRDFDEDDRELLNLTADFLSETITFLESVQKEVYNVTSDKILKDLWINMILL